MKEGDRLPFLLKAWDGSSQDVSGWIEQAHGLTLHFDGFGDALSHDQESVQVLIDVEGGDVVLRVWADRTKEDPTHTISLKGARLCSITSCK